MFAGDGCLPIKIPKDGYRRYPVVFYNTNKNFISLFANLFYKNFGIKGNIRRRIRENKKDLWEFEKYSKEIYNTINTNFEIPCGKKALNVRIPSFILNGENSLKKYFFLGLLITDGCIRKKGGILFHSASENLIKDLKILINNVWDFDRGIKNYIQRNKFRSYQLTLNKGESSKILSDLPRSHNLVLHRIVQKNKVNLESG